MQQPQNRSQKQPQEMYSVFWIGKDNKTVFTKKFSSQDEATTFAKPVKYAVILHLKKATPEAMQFNVVPTLSARELVKNIKIRKHLDKKNKFINADGLSESTIGTTSAIKHSKNVRLFKMLVFTPILIYAGTRKELPQWLRYSLFAIAGLNLVTNYSNYISNNKVIEEVDVEEEER